MRRGGPIRHVRWLHWFIGSILGAAALGTAWVVHESASRPGARDESIEDGAPSRALNGQRNGFGVVVEGVAPSKGETVGLLVGDRVVSCNDLPLVSPAAVHSVVENAVGSDTLVFQVVRDGKTLSVAAPRAGFWIEVRADLPVDALEQYEQGKSAQRSGDSALAAQAWEHAAQLTDQCCDDRAAAWLRTRAAQAHESRQRWADASQSYRTALERWPPGTDDASRSRALFGLGKCLLQQADANSARQHFEEARRLDAAANRRMWEGADLHALGILSWSLGDFGSARQCFGDAVAIREQLVPDSPQLGESLNGLGAVANQEGDLDRAEDYYRRSLDICKRAMPESLAVADGLNNLGVIAIARGDLDAAYHYNLRSLAIRERLAPDSEAVTAALTNMGIVEYKRGHLQAAQDYYGRSLSIHERLGKDSIYMARDFINMGVVAYDRGDLDAAQDYYSRGLAILERLAPDTPDCMASVYNLGMVAIERGDWDLAERNLGRALAFRERTAPDSLAVAETCNALGNLAYARSSFNTAESHYARALEIEERLAPESLVVSTSLHNLGGVALQRGQLDAAKSYYKRALVIRERMAPGSLDLASSLHGLGDIILRQGRPGEAIPLLIQAIETIERQRDHIQAIQSRAFLLARYSEPYMTLQNAYLALHDPSSAFDTIERARARSLLDGLSEARSDIREGVEPALLERERDLQAKLTAIDLERQTQIDRAADSRATTVENTLNELLVEYQDLQGQIRRASPRYAALTQPQPSSLTEIQQELLDEDTVLLEYALGQDQSRLWLVTSSDLHSYPLPSRADVDWAARRVHELVTARNHGPKGETVDQAKQRIEQADQDYRDAVTTLGDMVLGPVADGLSKKRLLIVADGALQYVPFGALPTPSVDKAAPPAASSTPAAARPPLILDHEVISLPSASVLAVLRREIAGREPAPKSVAVLADPVLVPDDPRVTRNESEGGGTDPLRTSTIKDPLDKPRHRGVGSIEPAVMQRLRFTRLEAESILALATEPGLAALDFEASKRTALNPDLGRYRILHLATHGLLDSQHPELSGIVLSLVDERGQPQDGFLRLHEIYNLRLNADLVVLSACQTALGREVRGEGLVGLTRGFMYAGAARVVASLWSVQDKATAELMKAFYEAMLRDGQTPAAALRTAQVRMWKEGREPYYWAAFVLQGEYR